MEDDKTTGLSVAALGGIAVMEVARLAYDFGFAKTVLALGLCKF